MPFTHTTDERVVGGRQAGHPPRPAVEPALPFPYSAKSVLGMQPLAGNRAVSLAVQRCGPGSNCACPPEERAAKEAALQRQTAKPVQRQADEQSPATAGGGGPEAGGDLSMEQMRALITELEGAFGGTATFVPWPAEGGALAAGEQTSGPAVQTLPVQRAAAAPMPLTGAKHPWLQAGMVSSAQLTYDACTGKLSGDLWVWAGAGTYWAGTWVGGYYFWEGGIDFGEIGKLADCGTCSANCQPGEHHGGGGVGIFKHLVPGSWSRYGVAGFEFGALLTPSASLCDGTLEVILLVNFLENVPQIKAAKKILDAANKVLARYGQKLDVDFEFGGQVNGGAHVCRNPAGSWTFDHLTLGGGVFGEVGVGVERDKSKLPH